jgi:hypothetical protein
MITLNSATLNVVRTDEPQFTPTNDNRLRLYVDNISTEKYYGAFLGVIFNTVGISTWNITGAHEYYESPVSDGRIVRTILGVAMTRNSLVVGDTCLVTTPSHWKLHSSERKVSRPLSGTFVELAGVCYMLFSVTYVGGTGAAPITFQGLFTS